ncbi:MAG TPA: AAA family ATPase [Phycisphaerae bacterium]|nr:AAA family ATPase [Phycisphaerae bacterium]
MARVISVTGKGGVGKTTIAALIIRYLKEHERGPILALDADPDCNLAAILGIPLGTTIGDLREDMLRRIKDFPPGMSKEAYFEAGLHEIIVETPKVDLITMGRGEGPGCYCFINNLLRKFADDLMPSYQWVVMDNEAGLEHLSRRTASRIDDLIVVVNDNPLALDCAKRIDKLLADLKRPIGSRYFLLNAVEAGREAIVRERLAGLGLEYLGNVPRDASIVEALYRGESVYGLVDGPALDIISRIMQKIGAQ